MFWSLFYHFYRWYVTAFESWFACTFVTCCSITHTHPFNGPFPGLLRWAGTRKAKLIWILLKQEIVSGSGISWAICKSAPHSRQITTPAPYHSVFYRPDALPAAQPTVSKHWRQYSCSINTLNILYVIWHHPVSAASCRNLVMQLARYDCKQPLFPRGLFCMRKTKGTGWCR